MSKKMLMILVAGLLAAVMIGGGGLFYMKSKGSASENGKAAEGAKDSGEKAAEDKNKVNFPLENFIVNLADPGGKRYLSTKIVLELNDKKVVPSIENKVPEMRDRILMILPTKTFQEIQSVSGKNVLKDTLITELNSLLQEGKITNIFFQEFVVQ